MTAKPTRAKAAPKKNTRLTRKNTRKQNGKAEEPSSSRVDPMDSIWKSRERERQEMLQSQQELRELVQESQLRILAMRTKGNLARLKLVNKALDD